MEESKLFADLMSLWQRGSKENICGLLHQRVPNQTYKISFSLVTWEISQAGSFIDGKKRSETTVSDLNLAPDLPVTVRIGNQPDAKYVGGFVLFGKGFGDYNQDIVFSIVY